METPPPPRNYLVLTEVVAGDACSASAEPKFSGRQQNLRADTLFLERRKMSHGSESKILRSFCALN